MGDSGPARRQAFIGLAWAATGAAKLQGGLLRGEGKQQGEGEASLGPAKLQGYEV